MAARPSATSRTGCSAPVLVFSTNEPDLKRFRMILQRELPSVEMHFARSSAEAQAHLGSARVLYGWRFPVELLHQMPNLQWVQKMGAGVDDVIRPLASLPGVLLTRTDGRLIAARMVDYVLAAILNRTLRLKHAQVLREERRWDYFEVDTIRSRTIGIAGLGEIGSEIAAACRSLGAQVLGWRRSPTPCAAVSKLYAGREEFLAFLKRCDVVVSVLPATEETRSIFDGDAFSECKRGVHIINVGRGEVIDETALLRALETEQVAYATLDVFKVEPLPHEHPFWSHPQITITPHICGPLIPDDVAPHFVANYRAFMSGEPLRNLVNRSRQY